MDFFFSNSFSEMHSHDVLKCTYSPVVFSMCIDHLYLISDDSCHLVRHLSPLAVTPSAAPGDHGCTFPSLDLPVLDLSLLGSAFLVSVLLVSFLSLHCYHSLCYFHELLMVV